MYRVFLFDLDGVLADTSEYHYLVLIRSIISYGQWLHGIEPRLG